MGISLISLGKGVERYLFCSKREEANFVLESSVGCLMERMDGFMNFANVDMT